MSTPNTVTETGTAAVYQHCNVSHFSRLRPYAFLAMSEDSARSLAPHRSRLEECPPSAKLVAKVLKEEGTLTQAQLAAETHLSKRTIRYALSDLESADIVRSEISFVDARQQLYSIAPPDA